MLSSVEELPHKIDGSYTMKNPVHVEAYHVPDIYQMLLRGKRIMVTPKADGFTKHIKVMSNDQLNGDIMECEKIEMNGVSEYVIIDIVKDKRFLSNASNNTGRFSRTMGSINSLSNGTRSGDTSRFSKIENRLCLIPGCIFDFDVNQMDINDIISIINVKKYLWRDTIVKPVINLINCCNPNDATKALIFLFSDCETYFKNDGWIVYLEGCDTPLKIKPMSELTIDLLYRKPKCFYSKAIETVKNVLPTSDVAYDHVNYQFDFSEDESMQSGYVYRVLPILNHDGSVSLTSPTYRSDKIEPNRSDIVKSVISRIKTHWTPLDVLERFKTIGHVYYDDDKIQPDIDVNEYLRRQKISIKNCVLDTIKKFFADKSNDVCKVFDIGCGSGSIGTYITSENKNFSYYGIDKDPIILSSSKRQHPGQIFIWGDVNNPSDPEYYTKHITDTMKFDMILSINSIHYVNIDTIQYIVQNYIKDHSIFFLFGMFSEEIDGVLKTIGSNRLEIDDNFYIEYVSPSKVKGKTTYGFYYPWIKKYFTEDIYSKEFLKETLRKIGMNVILDEPVRTEQVLLRSKKYDKIISIHSMVCFTNVNCLTK
jgi:SAM-dependent methyltransferase